MRIVVLAALLALTRGQDVSWLTADAKLPQQIDTIGAEERKAGRQAAKATNEDKDTRDSINLAGAVERYQRESIEKWGAQPFKVEYGWSAGEIEGVRLNKRCKERKSYSVPTAHSGNNNALLRGSGCMADEKGVAGADHGGEEDGAARLLHRRTARRQ